MHTYICLSLSQVWSHLKSVSSYMSFFFFSRPQTHGRKIPKAGREAPATKDQHRGAALRTWERWITITRWFCIFFHTKEGKLLKTWLIDFEIIEQQDMDWCHPHKTSLSPESHFIMKMSTVFPPRHFFIYKVCDIFRTSCAWFGVQVD